MTATVTSLLGPDVDIVDGRPDPAMLDRDGCGLCGVVDCRPIATITWDHAYGAHHHIPDETIVGRGCLSDAIVAVRDTAVEGSTIAVDIPVWSRTLAAHEAHTTWKTIRGWVEAGWLGEGARGDRLDAGHVHTARRLAEFVALGLEARAAHRLMSACPPDVAEAFVEALRESQAVAA